MALRVHLRSLLVLGRVSNLPTVWSNCLAAWLLSGDVFSSHLLLLCTGATLLYTGGMFLNDAFDVEFDRQHRSERPIPSGQISSRAVWLVGGSLLLVGWLLLLPLGYQAALFALMLLLVIVIYDAFHKLTPLAPLIMAACRFLLYGVAADAAESLARGVAVWHGLAMATYVVGLSYMARGESNHSSIGRWPMLLLLAPIVANVAVNPHRTIVSWVVTAGFVVWMGWCLRERLAGATKGVGKAIPGLLAGIVLVDWSAIGNPSRGVSLGFAGLFFVALILQRKVPAT